MTTSIHQSESTAPTIPLGNTDEDLLPQSHADAELRRLVTWGSVLGIAILTAVIFGYIGYLAVHAGLEPTNWIIVILKLHYAAIVGTPMCAFLAFFIVSILKVTSGPIELEAMGVKFEGASGPIVPLDTVFPRGRLRFPHALGQSVKMNPASCQKIEWKSRTHSTTPRQANPNRILRTLN